jgi:hypothetical protein
MTYFIETYKNIQNYKKCRLASSSTNGTLHVIAKIWFSLKLPGYPWNTSFISALPSVRRISIFIIESSFWSQKTQNSSFFQNIVTYVSFLSVEAMYQNETTCWCILPLVIGMECFKHRVRSLQFSQQPCVTSQWYVSRHQMPIILRPTLEERGKKSRTRANDVPHDSIETRKVYNVGNNVQTE